MRIFLPKEIVMSLLATAKRVSIASGLYRPARWLSRRIRPSQLRALRDDIELYRSLLRPGALCFDVGANIGEKSEALLEAGARVVAFEPNPLVLPELQARCGHHKNWTVVATALGSGAAIATLHARESHGQSSLAAEWGGNVIATYNVPVVTLDSAIQCFGSPAFCKIDVEGWELEVMRGLTQPIPLISFEFHLNDPGIRKTIACLEKLTQFGASRANITPAETSTFHFEEWIPLAQFLGWFPGDLEQSLPGFHYGDIFVKSDAA
jgi:FkbM family methyltransferase